MGAGDIITKLDDISLAWEVSAERKDAWSQYLLTSTEDQIPLERGWCVEASWFKGEE